MVLSDYLLIAGIVLALGWAIRTCFRNHAKGKSCNGDCTNCGNSCKNH